MKPFADLFKLLARGAVGVSIACALSGCEAPLRAPVCKEGEFEFPPGAAGRYRFSIIGQSLPHAGAYAHFDDFEFEIAEAPDHYELKLFSAIPQSSIKSDISVGIRMPLSACRIGTNYYAQNRNDDSTYSLSRLDVSETGLTTNGLAWSAEALKKAGVPYYIVPELEDVSNSGEFTFAMMSPVSLIVENSGIDDATRLRLLEAARTLPIGSVFSRISDAKESRKPVKRRIRLSKSS